MSTNTVAIARPSRVVPIGIVGFAAALALASQVALPIPGTPVPITLQPLVVVLAGMWLGPVAGAASMVLYLCAGAIGLPVFSPFGAPGIARFLGRWIAALAGSSVLLLGGLAQLAILNGSFLTALPLAIHPFVPLDAVKAFIAAALVPKSTLRAPV
jgi:biotin transport system substrate-specific component